jgi:tetratricopeptide (TPR) repeat protein
MLGWVNLHLGFAAGLAMGVAYLMLEGFAVLFPRSRQAASRRLQAAWPWLALTAAATLANPWGARLYGALVRQQQAQDFHSAWLVEWENIRPSLGSLHQALDGRDPQSAFWWLLLAAAICGLRALWRRQPGSAILLAAASYAALQHVRFQALFACVVVVVGGSILRDAQPDGPGGLNDARGGAARYASTAAIRAVAMGLLGLLVGVRVFDLTSNRYYLRTSQLSSFGSGISWWFPERAVEFIEREKLPGKVFSGYDMGGYLTWRLPQYPDYVDGRAIPFGRDLFFRAYELSVEPPDSAVWRREAETRGINTILVSLARDRGIELFPQLQAFCQSRLWRPVYMDEVSAVLVRRTAATEGLVDRLQIDCQKVQFATGVKAARDKASRFNAMASAAGVLDALGRDEEALVSLDEAEGIFAGSANLHLTRGLVLEHRGRTAEAEAEFRASLELGPTEEAWLDVGLLYMTERRYGEAAEAFRRGAESSTRPHDLWMLLGQADLQMGQAQAALEAFDRAEGASPFRGGGAEAALGAGFESMVATGRAKAWYQLGDSGKAVGYQEEAVKLAPGDGKLWAGLADLYAAEGRGADAERARGRSGGR